MDKNVINKISNDIWELFNTVMKNVLNTVKDESPKIKANDDGDVYTIMYNYYLDYVESGRRPFVTRVPFQALVKWAKEKGIPSDNNTIFAIRESIYQTGIKARPIFDTFENAMDKEWEDKISDEILKIITGELDKIFE